jgi:hypothetical protein
MAFVQNTKNLRRGAIVTGKAMVAQNAVIHNRGWVEGNAQVFGNAIVHRNSLIRDNARVYGDAVIGNNAFIKGEADISCNNDWFTMNYNGKVLTGYRSRNKRGYELFVGNGTKISMSAIDPKFRSTVKYMINRFTPFAE